MVFGKNGCAYATIDFNEDGMMYRERFKKSFVSESMSQQIIESDTTYLLLPIFGKSFLPTHTTEKPIESKYQKLRTLQK